MNEAHEVHKLIRLRADVHRSFCKLGRCGGASSGKDVRRSTLHTRPIPTHQSQARRAKHPASTPPLCSVTTGRSPWLQRQGSSRTKSSRRGQSSACVSSPASSRTSRPSSSARRSTAAAAAAAAAAPVAAPPAAPALTALPAGCTSWGRPFRCGWNTWARARARSVCPKPEPSPHVGPLHLPPHRPNLTTRHRVCVPAQASVPRQQICGELLTPSARGRRSGSHSRSHSTEL